jgi:hypothetical protein
MQCPPIPTLGLKGINPYGFVDEASITSLALMPALFSIWVSS